MKMTPKPEILSYNDSSRRYGRELRGRLYTKDRHQRFRSAIPFDLVNLDIYGTFFPPKSGVLSPMLQSIRTLLDWQTEFATANPTFDSFTMFVTAHVEGGKVNEEALGEMITMIETNRSAYSGFSRALEQRFGSGEPESLACRDFDSFYSIALPKVIISEAFERGWNAKAKFSGRYQRARKTTGGTLSSTYSMLAWVGRFDRYRPDQLKLGLPDATRSRDYANIINNLTHETLDVDQETSTSYGETEFDLAQVVAYRDEYLKGIRSGP